MAAALQLLANLAQAEPACVVVLCRMPLEGCEASAPQLMAFLAEILSWPDRLAVPASVLSAPLCSVDWLVSMPRHQQLRPHVLASRPSCGTALRGS